MKIITSEKGGKIESTSDIEEDKNEASSDSAISRKGNKVIKREKRKRSKYVYINAEIRIMLLIAKVDLGLKVREASKLLEIPYTSAKTICREFNEENKILSKTQMKRHKRALHTSFKIE